MVEAFKKGCTKMHPFVVLVVVKRDCEQLFTRLKPIEPPVGLLGRIMRRIEKERRLALRWRFAFLSIALAASAAASVFAFRGTLLTFAESGFPQFFSLLFSDSGLMLAYRHDFALALLESLPVASIAALFAVILIFLGSLRYLFRDIRAASLSSRRRGGLYPVS